MVEDSLQSRRRKRGQTTEQEKPLKEYSVEMTNGDEIVEDDEAVRCICGNDEYPGPPQLEEDSKKGIKDSSEVEFITEADYTEDLAGFFLQCDMCKVWQHGGCVGIKNEDMSPEEYFCELCRKDLHKIYTAPNG
jgi:PHD-finger